MLDHVKKFCHTEWKNANEIHVRSIELMIKYYRYCVNFTDAERAIFVQIIKEESIQKTVKIDNFELVVLIIILVMFIISVMKYRQLQTARNVFILNLAISDLCLCIFTQPFNLLRLLVKYHPWTYGDVLCKMSALLQGTNVFVSTITITAIALDRFQRDS